LESYSQKAVNRARTQFDVKIWVEKHRELFTKLLNS
jgi:hypothetical protein